MSKRNKLYAAHGFYINPVKMADKCPTAAIVGTSELKGYRLLFKGAHAEAVAAVEPDKTASVPVLLWEITPTDEATLDHCEGFPALCHKETVKVRLNRKTVTVMLYIMNGEITHGRPGAYHYNSILEGYQSAGFDTDILHKSLLTSTETTEPLSDEPL